MSVTDSRLVCAGCGALIDEREPRPFRCPCADEQPEVDHVVRRELDLDGTTFPGGVERSGGSLGPGEAASGCETDAIPGQGPDGGANPFIRYRTLLHSWRLARRHGMADADYVALVLELDEKLVESDGRLAEVLGVAGATDAGSATSHGFRTTPLHSADALGAALGIPAGALLIKDETSNVAGSHKARHLMGIALFLEVSERVLGAPRAEQLAIASCGNAALAAAVLARALQRRLTVFIPTWAEASVVEALRSLGAETVACPRRQDDPPGDPVTHAFRRAVQLGAVPFTCQGSENGLTIEGGQTLGWELAAQLGERAPDRLLIQVGGGALASATIQGLREAHELGALSDVPRLHTLQTEGGHPLERAWRRVAADVAAYVRRATGEACSGDAAAGAESLRAGSPGAAADTVPDADAPAARWAAWLSSPAASVGVHAVLSAAPRHRARYMWAWEPAPESLATGILDDETYDWLELVRAMIATGGWPVVATEADVAKAHQLARRHTASPVSATGSAGLAGLIALRRDGTVDADERVLLLFTGVR